MKTKNPILQRLSSSGSVLASCEVLGIAGDRGKHSITAWPIPEKMMCKKSASFRIVFTDGKATMSFKAKSSISFSINELASITLELQSQPILEVAE